MAYCTQVCGTSAAGPILSDADYGPTTVGPVFSAAPVYSTAAEGWTEDVADIGTFSTPAYAAPSYAAPSYAAPAYAAPAYAAPAYAAPSYAAAPVISYSTAPAYTTSAGGLPCCENLIVVGDEVLDDGTVVKGGVGRGPTSAALPGRTRSGRIQREGKYVQKAESMSALKNIIRGARGRTVFVQYYRSGTPYTLPQNQYTQIAKERKHDKLTFVKVDVSQTGTNLLSVVGTNKNAWDPITSPTLVAFKGGNAPSASTRKARQKVETEDDLAKFVRHNARVMG